MVFSIPFFLRLYYIPLQNRKIPTLKVLFLTRFVTVSAEA